MNLNLEIKKTEEHNNSKEHCNSKEHDNYKENNQGHNNCKSGGKGTLNSGRSLDGAKLENAVILRQGSTLFFDNKSEWLTTAEAATYLRKFSPEGIPSLNAVHKLVSQGRIRRRKFSGRLYFKRRELDYLIESSGA